MQKAPFLSSFCFFMIFLSFLGLSFGADTLSSGQSMNDGETRVSSGQGFELGFFSPGSSKSRFLGIWYKMTPETVVWVANRDNPLNDSGGVLTFSDEGNLILLNQSKSVIWSSYSSVVLRNPVAQLLESGNLVLREDASSSSEDYSWQSFDHPSDTLLSSMKLGWDFRTGTEKYLTSWKSRDDPSPGEYTFRLRIHGLPQFEVFNNASVMKFRSGSWNGIQFSGLSIGVNPISRQIFVYNQTDVYFEYDHLKDGILTRIVLNESGLLQRLARKKGGVSWTVMYSHPIDPCENYALCGANGFCRSNIYSRCDCLRGFVPKVPEQWQMLDWSGGCVRKVSVNCSKGEEFFKLSRVKLPDLIDFWLDENISLAECRVRCLKNCSCTAYANSDVRGGGSGCLMWFGDLMDTSEFEDAVYEQDLHIRLSASQLYLIQIPTKRKRLVVTIGVTSAISGLLLLGIILWTVTLTWKRVSKIRDSRHAKDDIDLPLFELDTIAAATNNFSPTNMIGSGGFGSVYKGNLSTNQEIAVQRLSKNSGQGREEFMNEAASIAGLQHKNLVGLLGCCIEKEERMLIYEYMTNKSLDNFIFDCNRPFSLEWEKRFDIIIGIGRGLLYLHQDSKVQVIHRDLKTSNILLDANLNPKISDFGLARIFRGDEKEARTKRIIGTFGYMCPEYAIDGKFSVKSDVFSFGVLLLETVSGKRNRGFCHQCHHHNLLGHAWLLWNEGRALELTDDSLADSCIEFQVERSIQVGLLCVQKFPADRPTMSSVVFMLANQEAILPQPKQPGFYMEEKSNKLGFDFTERTLYKSSRDYNNARSSIDTLFTRHFCKSPGILVQVA
ncbi:G-type lectin S-receptor-like serine/threonine-protein kinase At4g27290 isoform X2 [Syzygium oleosum]|uniref:G-type lectin S-receptor-like serine/threonine-protein kinase At4g27290 isoform X2 n=1 Tax=Syzygium oleosum TaxID=219896 RepID=UPI0024BB142B|nr:G-type lectin S-receptor-like serine/threonine-protein kinase At4g27290 isoform X2 [Syzygium oleosum]